MASRTYDIELSCGCFLSADGGGGCIPCAAAYLGYDPNYAETEQDRELQRRCSEAWKEFRESGKLEEYERECEMRNR